jgi:hypothetical protein
MSFDCSAMPDFQAGGIHHDGIASAAHDKPYARESTTLIPYGIW